MIVFGHPFQPKTRSKLCEALVVSQTKSNMHRTSMRDFGIQWKILSKNTKTGDAVGRTEEGMKDKQELAEYEVVIEIKKLERSRLHFQDKR